MQPYSIDLRQKIIEVYEEEKISIRKIAERFRVAKSFVQKLLKQFQKTGDIKPKRQGGNSPPKVQGADLVTLTEIIESNIAFLGLMRYSSSNEQTSYEYLVD